MNIREVIFFSYGDSNKASTWSNVPYLFAKTLELKGIKVRRVNLLKYGLLEKIYNYLLIKLYSVFYTNHIYSYIRTPLYRRRTFSRIKKSVEKFSNADLCIFLCFDFWNKFSDIPSLLFCDWTYDIVIMERLKRAPYSFERRYSEWQGEAINSAKVVVSLFPECANSMSRKYPNANIHYLGVNVVNNLYEGNLDISKVIADKKNNKKILFIGGPKYREGCLLLVNAFELLYATNNEYELHVIGMSASDIPFKQDRKNVFFYGYLSKDDIQQRNLYYKLVVEASVFVNPTEIWGGYSSTIEAMFFYTPVVVSPYKDFVAEFGENINFGVYNQKFTENSLYDSIKNVVTSPKYESMCINAHDATKNYTWDRYVEKMLALVK